ncbi:hypothetical protein EYF80_033888 [Liparis tanakae]|uniref:Uncharacterized protein n=1 Tax=Liparis tanakae TaxID=230148 RepID=A0A4Z2GR68_9TELE|nr:hypothetical protein EYF80_033888 [Liparis tanakae]
MLTICEGLEAHLAAVFAKASHSPRPHLHHIDGPRPEALHPRGVSLASQDGGVDLSMVLKGAADTQGTGQGRLTEKMNARRAAEDVAPRERLEPPSPIHPDEWTTRGHESPMAAISLPQDPTPPSVEPEWNRVTAFGEDSLHAAGSPGDQQEARVRGGEADREGGEGGSQRQDM